MNKELTSVKKYAFVTLLMHNPQYIYGTIAMGYSLKLSNTKYELVCMITDDLYDYYKKYIEFIYDKVIKVPYLKYTKSKLHSTKHKEIYNDWYNISYTKWQCLQLTEYSKICFLDSDLIILNNIDHLLDITAPAACFVNFWSEFGWNKKNYYKNIKLNSKIPNNIIKQGLIDSFTLVGHCVVLEPNIDEYNQFNKFMLKNFIPNKKCISMLDEQSLSSFYLSLNKNWTQLHHIYNSIPWKISNTNIKSINNNIIFDKPYILHYFNKLKPWMGLRNKWTDVEIWYQYYDLLICNKPALKNIKFSQADINKHCIVNINKFNININKLDCIYCLFLNESFINQKKNTPIYINDLHNNRILYIKKKYHNMFKCIYK